MDGGSTDGTVAWLAGHERTGEEGAIKAYHWTSEPDNGLYDAINKGWACAQGDILSWLNCDEQYLPGVLNDVADTFARFPDVDVVFGDAIIVDPSGTAMAMRREVPLRHFYIRNTFLNAYTCTMFFRRRLWDSGALRFDTRFRYAGDMDLILRLLESGVKQYHTHRTHALFTAGGNNLSLHGRMRQETECVCFEHGGFRTAWFRRLAQCLRQTERLVKGHYVPRTVDYDYAENEDGVLSHRRGVRLSGRFNIARMRA